MSSLITFPTHIPPARVTMQLVRVDETIFSPLTNVQQVLSRGNPAWRWTYEFTDLSLEERDIVESFLLACKGSTNFFKVIDPAHYQIKGSISDWIDIFSNYGDFSSEAGSSGIAINSYFGYATRFKHRRSENNQVQFEWISGISADRNIYWKGHGALNGKVASLQGDAIYAQRIKFFQNPGAAVVNITLNVSSGNGSQAFISNGLNAAPTSDCVITVPFWVTSDTLPNSVNCSVFTSPFSGGFDQPWDFADYRLFRCALISDPENKFKWSNVFSASDWTKTNAGINSESGISPEGFGAPPWRLNVQTAVNTYHRISQSYTKPQTEDLWTMEIYARAAAISEVRLELDNGSASHRANVIFWLNSGTTGAVSVTGSYSRAAASIVPQGEGTDWYLLRLTTLVTSHNTIRGIAYAASGTGINFTGASEYVELFGASLVNFPIRKQYTVTSDTVISSKQNGAQAYMTGFNAGDIIKAGTRMEIINRYHNSNSSYNERSEFKRVTKETAANFKGIALIEFEPPIRNSPAPDRSLKGSGHLGESLHNIVIFHKPEMQARLLNGTIQFIEKPLQMTDVVFDIIEDLTS